MGTGLRFIEEGRAAYIALLLQAKGFGVLWEPTHPLVVMTAASKQQVKDITKANKGTIETWWAQDRIDV